MKKRRGESDDGQTVWAKEMEINFEWDDPYLFDD